MSIQPLPPDVIAQIKSSTAITNLNGVIVELVKNSLDAGSTKIDISVDYARGGCVVEDDGLGILPSEFGESGGLGKIYHSSKLGCQTPLHGGRGTFLASLSAMALISIISHHHSYRSHNSMSMHKSQVISRQIPASAQQYLPYFDHGTRVTVRDLFGSMPVRVKQRAMTSEKQGNGKDWELLKREVVLLLLAWPSGVSVTIREVTTNQKAVFKSPQPILEIKVDVSKVCSILSQASLITADERSSWIPVKASMSTMEVNGAISLFPYPTKHVQFLAFGIQPLVAVDGQNIFHEEINRLFQNSAFGNEEETEELDGHEVDRRVKDARYKWDGFTSKELKVKKGVDRWPMYYINIQNTTSANVDVDDILDDKGSNFASIMELIQAMVLEFLTKNHFRPKLQRMGSRRTGEYPRDGDLEEHSSKPTLSKHARNHKTVKRKSTRRQVSNSDLLGANIKLPSFRQPLQSESPFDAWSRVKSGTAKPPKPPSPPHRPSTAPLPSIKSLTSTIRSPTSTLSHRSKSSKPSLVSSSGKITRRPFDESGPALTPRTPALNGPKYPNDFANLDDDIIAWINPITKVRSLVNQRTGLTLPALDVNGVKRPLAATRLSSREKLTSTPKNQEPSPWIDSLLKKWDNPIFPPVEPPIAQVSLDSLELETHQILHGNNHNCSQLDIDRAFKDVSAGINGRISKVSLRDAEVIAQVDKKFILLKLLCSNNPRDSGEETLVIIDQHAADERIRIEGLLAELCQPPSPNHPNSSRILTTPLEKPLVFEVSAKEIQLFQTHRQHFANWGMVYSVAATLGRNARSGAERLHITHLPPIIAERCRTTPKLLIDLLRTELHSPTSCPSLPTATASNEPHPWLSQIHNLPQSLLNMLNSRACRSAIMFNDVLSKKQCEELVRNLADCAFPFQCAHGRVSGVPILGLGGNLMLGKREEDGEREVGFGRAMRLWKQRM